MNARQLRLLASVRNAALVLDDRAFHTRTISPLRTELRAVVKKLNELEITQDVATRSVTSDRYSVSKLKAELRTKHLLPLTRRAKMILKGYPGIEESLRLPPARGDVKTHADAAKRILKALRPHSSALIGAGFSKSVLTDCDRAARAMTERHASPDTYRSRRSAATRSIPRAIREGREIIEVVDSHVNAELSDNRTLVNSWRRAKRVPARLGRPRKRHSGDSTPAAQRP